MLIKAPKLTLMKLFKLSKHLRKEEIRQMARSQKVKEKAKEKSLSGVHCKEVAEGMSKKSDLS